MGSLSMTRRSELLKVLDNLCKKGPSQEAIEAAKQKVREHPNIKAYEKIRDELDVLRKKFAKSMREAGREANALVDGHIGDNENLDMILDDLDLANHFEIKLKSNPMGQVQIQVKEDAVEASIRIGSLRTYGAAAHCTLAQEPYDSGINPIAKELLAMAHEEAKLATTEKELISLIRQTKSEIDALDRGEEDERGMQSGEGDDNSGSAAGEIQGEQDL